MTDVILPWQPGEIDVTAQTETDTASIASRVGQGEQEPNSVTDR
jgi:hypothetical protein